MKVIEIVYLFINKIREEGVQEYIYEELKNKKIIDFDNITKHQALSYAQKLAKQLNYYKSY